MPLTWPQELHMNSSEFQKKTFLLLLTIVSIAFGWIVWPFFGAVFWGTVLAIMFAPLYRRLLVVTRGRRNLAALATLVLCLIIVILPLAFITASLVQGRCQFLPQASVGRAAFRHIFSADH